MKRIPRRLFTEEFKREAIKLVTEQHLNVAAAGRKLDLDPKSIRSWITESERGELKATLGCWRRFKTEHLCRFKIDQAFKRCSVLHR